MASHQLSPSATPSSRHTCTWPLLPPYLTPLPPQWLIKAVVVHRWVHDPLNSYVDLLFLSNVSLVLLDDRQCGYYLHGRNQMPHTGEERAGCLVLWPAA